MSLVIDHRKGRKAHELHAAGVDSDFIAERLGLTQSAVNDILRRPCPEAPSCAKCGRDPGWARAWVIGSLVFCAPCATYLANDGYPEAVERWPSIFPQVSQ